MKTKQQKNKRNKTTINTSTVISVANGGGGGGVFFALARCCCLSLIFYKTHQESGTHSGKEERKNFTETHNINVLSLWCVRRSFLLEATRKKRKKRKRSRKNKNNKKNKYKEEAYGEYSSCNIAPSAPCFMERIGQRQRRRTTNDNCLFIDVWSIQHR